MAKLNLNKIKGQKAVELGKQNMNEESMKLIDDRKKTSFVDMDLIDNHDDNSMSMPNVDWLEQDIAMQGLLQPLVVIPTEDGRYKLYAGHQRLAAIRRLKEKGKWNPDNLVEVKFTDLDRARVPETVKKSTKEKMLLRGLNIQREKSDLDKYIEVQDWEEIYADLRANGVEVMTFGVGDDGKETVQQIKGVKTQTLIAQQMGISHAAVGQFQKVKNRGSQELIDALKAGKVDIATAQKIASREKEEQKEIIEKALENKGEGEKITGNDIMVAEYKIEKEKKAPVKKEVIVGTEDETDKENAETVIEETVEGELITEKELKNLLKPTFKFLKKENVRLDEIQFARLLKHIRSIENIITEEPKSN